MTIKTQGGKVITKGGKVSCECCGGPGECCMYPAQALVDGLYTIDDLPDTIVVIGSEETPYSCLVTKTNGSSPYYSGTCEGQQSRIIINDDNNWEFQVFTPEDGWLEPQDRSPNECLIFDPNIEGNAYLEDQFADTYTVTVVYGPPGNETISFSITRISICEWEGSDGVNPETWKLFYATPENIFADPLFYYKFYLDQSVSRVKLGFMNTPAGAYDPTGDLEISVTVS